MREDFPPLAGDRVLMTVRPGRHAPGNFKNPSFPFGPDSKVAMAGDISTELDRHLLETRLHEVRDRLFLFQLKRRFIVAREITVPFF